MDFSQVIWEFSEGQLTFSTKPEEGGGVFFANPVGGDTPSRGPLPSPCAHVCPYPLPLREVVYAIKCFGCKSNWIKFNSMNSVRELPRALKIYQTS